jgi:cytochrome P450
MAVTLDKLSRNPYPIYERLQREEPVSWIESLGMWFVTRRKQVLNVLLDEETYTVHSPSSPLEDTFGPMMLSRDGAEHTRLCAPFEPPFQSRAAANLLRALHPRGSANADRSFRVRPARRSGDRLLRSAGSHYGHARA